MLPIEKNARLVVGVMVQHFPAGASSNDLCQQFETQTGLARQSFYYALKYCKEQRWLIGGGRGQSYFLSSDGSWKEEPIQSTGGSIGVSRDKDQLEYLVDSQTRQIGELQDKVERLLDWSNGGDAGVALPSLVKIVGDGTASIRQRIKAAAAVFAYKVADSEVTTFVRRFLESVCTSTDIGNIDHKVEAAELLRRHEAPRVTPDSVRPAYSDDATGATRTEAWRVYERWQLRKQIVIETHAVPPPGWDNHLQRDTYAGPPEGNAMPPVRVVTDPVSGFRLIDNLLPKKPYRISGSSDDTSAS